MAAARFPRAISTRARPSRDGGLVRNTIKVSRPSVIHARVEMARGNRAAAIELYRRLTAVGPGATMSGVLEPLHVLALARLLDQGGDPRGARVEYSRFLTLWASADQALPEIDEARRAVARLPAS